MGPCTVPRCNHGLNLMKGIRWGREVVDYCDDPEASAVEVTLDDGTTETCDVLVGAEGIRSKIRQKKTGDELKCLSLLLSIFWGEGVGTTRGPKKGLGPRAARNTPAGEKNRS